LINADALDCDLTGWLADGVNKVVSNLPYSVGTRIIIELCQAAARPERIVVTVQREVAERIVAQPDERDYGLLSVLVQLDYAASIHKRVPRRCFYPVPLVESAIVVLVRRPRPMPIRDDAAFRALVKRCFEHRRKQLGSLVCARDALDRAGIDPRRRPETLSLVEWIRLANEH
jgi:16S rRNA (adenine1518-N6/adenine1519-N6)-dimethyltransferase